MKVESVTIVTPCRNAERLVGRTVQSILDQTAVRSGRLRLQYLVYDGASTDGTVEVVRRLCGDRAEIQSERDGGMYDALAKGLRRAEGDVVAWLNAGDVYTPTALDVVADVLEQTSANWVTGIQVTCNEDGQVIDAVLPHRYRSRLIRAGTYGGWLLPRYVQQESTFWRRSLQSGVDWERFASFRLAGDYYLWSRFARRADLRVVQSFLGGFTYHEGQLSEAREAYHREVASFAERAGPIDMALALLDGLAWHAAAIRSRLHHRRAIHYERSLRRWTDER
jgi:glycosyltransferase involved in cell wall biosynthesis